MKKILVISDSHGRNNLVRNVEKAYRDKVDFMIHCGDVCAEADAVRDFIAVQGNDEVRTGLFPQEKILECQGRRILILHGHTVFPDWRSFRPVQLANLAEEKECDAVCFGYTHQDYEGEVNGIRLFNPGSIGSENHTEGPRTFMILHVSETGFEAEKHMAFELPVF